MVFYLTEEGKRIIDPTWLYIYFRRNEFLREVTFRNFGSQRPEFNFEDMSDIIIPLPDLPTQQKYVDIYHAMVANQQAYERGLDDLKLTCDGYIEDLRRKLPCEKIGKYIIERNIKNEVGLNVDSVRGISTGKELIDTKANMDGVPLGNYKIVKPEYNKTNQVAAKKFHEMLEKTIAEYHQRRKQLTSEEAGETQEQASEDIIRSATEQALKILQEINESRESFRKVGLTFEEKAFYDVLITLRDHYNFEYGQDKVVNGITVNDKCKALAKKVKDIIDTKSSFADWLNNQIVRDQLKFDIKVCLIKNGYPPQYSPEVFQKVMEQVENFEENNG